MKSFWCVLLVLMVFIQNVNADDKDPNDPNELLLARWDAVIKDANDPNEMLKAKWDAVVNVIHADQLKQETKEEIIDKIVSPIFDFELMGKLTLGKRRWGRLTETQREKFINLFVKRLKNSYRDKIRLYKDEKVLLKPGVQKKSAIHIPMVLISSNKEIAILYKLRKSKNCWKIYDMEIEGVSIILTYRSQFDDILSHGTINDLLCQLEKPPSP